MYGFEYDDGYKTVMTANKITSKLFSQMNQDGKRCYYSTPSYPIKNFPNYQTCIRTYPARNPSEPTHGREKGNSEISPKPTE